MPAKPCRRGNCPCERDRLRFVGRRVRTRSLKRTVGCTTADSGSVHVSGTTAPTEAQASKPWRQGRRLQPFSTVAGDRPVDRAQVDHARSGTQQSRRSRKVQPRAMSPTSALRPHFRPPRPCIIRLTLAREGVALFCSHCLSRARTGMAVFTWSRIIPALSWRPLFAPRRYSP